MFLMRVFLLVLVLIFSLQTLTNAEDINKFEINGIKVSDSLLDHFTKEKISKNIKHINYEGTNKKFTSVDIYNFSNVYEFLQFHFKTNDKKYQIYSIDGIFSWNKSSKVCNAERQKINNDISNTFSNLKKEEVLNGDMASKRGFMDATEYYFPNGDFIQITCYKYKDQFKDYTNHGRVAIVRKELNDWLISIK